LTGANPKPPVRIAQAQLLALRCSTSNCRSRRSRQSAAPSA
jgi:hypothetical protein